MQTRVGNFPGVTVEKKVGRARWNGRSFAIIDLPGTYSLSPRTPDEMVSVDVLLGRHADIGAIDAVVCIVDAANLERNLYLFSQVLDLELPTVLVLNMRDLAAGAGVEIDASALAQRLGVAVVATEAHRKRGLENLRRAIGEAVEGQRPQAPRLFPTEFYAECDKLAAKLAANGATGVPAYLLERMVLDVGGRVEAYFAARHSPDLPAHLAAARERLKACGCRVPAVEAKVRYAWARSVLDGVVSRASTRPVPFSDKLDRFLTHRFAGLAVFAALMFVVFLSIFVWAEPLMALIEDGQGRLASMVEQMMPAGTFRSLLVDGVIAGVGGVVVFLPQIAFLFFFIAILEDCGYMARAAFLMDKLMTRVGLSGKSFVPLMSSFACAIPGVMSTRVIENRRDRMVTILVAPLMSCSARLPVYVLLIALFIPADQTVKRGLVLFAMYSLGMLVAIPVAWVLKKTFFRGETPPFVMELPTYKWPSPGVVLSRVYDRSKAFVTRAGTLILATTILVWAAAYFPGDHSRLDSVQEQLAQLETVDGTAADDAARLVAERNRLGSELIAESYLGRLGHAIEPAVAPLGWDWRIGVGAIASFPAREVIVATLGTIYSLGGDVDEADEGLRGALRSATWPDGRKVYNVPVALSIMVFFALCAQCAATLMVIKRETNSWLWPAFTFVYMTGLAYVGALATYQVGMLFT
jgi:ferrous iron transport protein B